MFKLENMASIGCNKIQMHLRYVDAPLYKQKRKCILIGTLLNLILRIEKGIYTQNT